MSETQSEAKNVFGEPLQTCCTDPMTGYYRTGYCETGPGDFGLHVVCAKVTDEFLEYTRKQGNDLSTPVPIYGFPGLKSGDRWCLCASRWQEALEAGVAPPVVLSATHLNTLAVIPLELLKEYAVDGEA
ncbi:DUF2237 domain-containing protein [Roseofilum sp. BLCC_M154]|uniref:DUF2237 domain-containing protein n=1 Tax=Roseofilum acuticapitatum BLCC-M154 TaxID=3022444 RepID=A0ABT7AX80_9CYAN|nr:DUF2237 domain-containing protein [Roseofilum acuticapitatum]MDJ1171524.1 DUF2237 domain-containing protein [Roseofilum acuticapitatum BLCC-M154]